jgi:hypothetical protein
VHKVLANRLRLVQTNKYKNQNVYKLERYVWEGKVVKNLFVPCLAVRHKQTYNIHSEPNKKAPAVGAFLIINKKELNFFFCSAANTATFCASSTC